jgi:hypothetical protein
MIRIGPWVCIFITSSTPPNIFLNKTFHFSLRKVQQFFLDRRTDMNNVAYLRDKWGDERGYIFSTEILYYVSLCCRPIQSVSCVFVCEGRYTSSISFMAFLTFSLSLSTARLCKCITIQAIIIIIIIIQ